jgi:hypothetical protein
VLNSFITPRRCMGGSADTRILQLFLTLALNESEGSASLPCHSTGEERAQYICPNKFCIVLTSTLVQGEWSASRLSRFTPGDKVPGIHYMGGWMGPRASLDDIEKRKFLKFSGLELWSLCYSARSQLLYRLRYPGSLYYIMFIVL